MRFLIKKIGVVVINRKGYSLKPDPNPLGWSGLIIGIASLSASHFAKGRFGPGLKICFYEIF